MAKRAVESVVTIHLDGKPYSATFTYSSGVVSVTHPIFGGPVATQAGGSPPEYIAKVLLRELVQSAKDRGEVA